MRPLDNQAAAGFFIGVARARSGRCEHTLPLFPLVLLLDAEGWLADDAKRLVESSGGKDA